MSARLYLIGLGLHSATVNGEPVSNAVLAPGYTAYSETLLYSTYDVGDLLKAGINTLGVELGKGIYDPEPSLGGRYMKFTGSPRQLMLKAQLEYTCLDSETRVIIPSNTTWLSNLDGPLLESCWWGGEEYDARQQIPGWPTTISDLSAWQAVSVTTPPPATSLIGQPYTDLEVVEQIPCVSVSQNAEGWTFDFGINFAGWFALNIDVPAGTRVVMWPAELLDSNGWAAQTTTGSPIFDAYTSNGTPGTYTPKFMYHGFRYLSVQNLTSVPTTRSIMGLSIRQSVEAIGNVSTSNSLLNNIHEIIDRSIQSNIYSMFTDCPHREKLGWLEQDHLVIDPVLWSYDMEAATRMVIKNVVDSQSTSRSMGNQAAHSGFIPEIAPEYVAFGYPFRDDPNWGGVVVRLPLKHYKTYGDIRVLSDNYAAMQSYLGYLSSLTSNYTLNYGLGDWETLDTCTGNLFSATFGWQQVVSGMIQIANSRIFQ